MLDNQEPILRPLEEGDEDTADESVDEDVALHAVSGQRNPARDYATGVEFEIERELNPNRHSL
jgi:hypothetical protein